VLSRTTILSALLLAGLLGVCPLQFAGVHDLSSGHASHAAAQNAPDADCRDCSMHIEQDMLRESSISISGVIADTVVPVAFFVPVCETFPVHPSPHARAGPEAVALHLLAGIVLRT